MAYSVGLQPPSPPGSVRLTINRRTSNFLMLAVSDLVARLLKVNFLPKSWWTTPQVSLLGGPHLKPQDNHPGRACFLCSLVASLLKKGPLGGCLLKTGYDCAGVPGRTWLSWLRGANKVHGKGSPHPTPSHKVKNGSLLGMLPKEPNGSTPNSEAGNT